MALAYELFAVVYILTLVTASIAALLFFVGPSRIKAEVILLNLKRNWAYLLALIVLPMALVLESRLSHLLGEPERAIQNASWMLAHGGSAVRYLQHRLEIGLVTDAFIFIYVWMFTFTIYFTPLYLLVKNDSPLFRRLSIALIVNYIVLLPFYIFLPVSVSSYTPGTMLKPLLYLDTYWGRLVTSMDPLDNDFPSGHISLMLTTLLVVSSSYVHRRYSHFLLWGMVSISVAVLYLGIHWIVDLLGGVALAVGATMLVWNIGVFRRKGADSSLSRRSEGLMVGRDTRSDDSVAAERERRRLGSLFRPERTVTRIFRRTR